MKLADRFSLQGRSAVVTGGSGALGGAMALALASAGARVAIIGRRREAAQQMAERIAAEGYEASAVACDVLDQQSLAQAAAELGAVDILVNAAGGNQPAATTSPERSFFDLDPAAMDAVVALNYTGTLLPCQVFGRGMAERGEGVIINISSMAAARPLTRVAGYGAAKSAVESLTRWLAVHMAQNYSPRIRVNAIAPGFFVGEQNRRLLLNEDGSLTDRGRLIIAHTPAGRFGTPEELAGALLWLASDASRFVTGIVVPVDGGFNAFAGV
jgi:NAD(P)-dependent dehydrogenase (short-subunit alcohol dehydrogenase family)